MEPYPKFARVAGTGGPYFREQALKVKYLLLSGTSSQSQIFIIIDKYES